jgi:UDP-N-acetylglucosamine transferase subunit ALG13
MIFLTVGSALPFDRLVRLIDEAVEDSTIVDDVFAQIGSGSYVPRRLEYARFLEKRQYDDCLNRATAIISHAGIGTISCALKMNKPILVMPRRKANRELVDDHQLMTARKFAAMGHVLTFSDRSELIEQLVALGRFQPSPRNPNVEGIAMVISEYLTELGYAARRSGSRPC